MSNLGEKLVLKKHIKNETDFRGIVLLGFVFVVAFVQYRFSRGQGTVVFPLELILAFIVSIMQRTTNIGKYFAVNLYLFYTVYKIVVSFAFVEKVTGNLKGIFYKELGIIILMMVFMNATSEVKILEGIRNIGIISSLIGCVEFFLKTSFFIKFVSVESRIFLRASLGTDASRVRTFLMHPIICAVFCVATFALLLYIPLKSSTAGYFAKLATIICLIGTQSRSGWVAFLIMVILSLMKRVEIKTILVKKTRVYIFVLVLLLVILMVCAFWDYTVDLYEILVIRISNAIDRRSAGNYNRVTMIKRGIAEWSDFSFTNKLFGKGAGYAIHYLRKNPIRGWSKAVDNTYITNLLDFGLVGLIQLLVIVLYSIITFFKGNNNVIKACSIGLIGMFVAGFFFDMFSWYSVTLVLASFLVGSSSANKGGSNV